MTLDLVAGLIEDGEEPLVATRRELREETGYESDDWSPLGSYVVNSNYAPILFSTVLMTDSLRLSTE